MCWRGNIILCFCCTKLKSLEGNPSDQKSEMATRLDNVLGQDSLILNLEV